MTVNPIACAAHQKRVEQGVLSAPRPGGELYPPKAWYTVGRAAGGLSARPGRIQQRSRMEHPASTPTRTTSPQLFETHNLALAAFLIAGRHLHYRSTHVEAGRATFVFEDLD